jgi:hypothetical protein
VPDVSNYQHALPREVTEPLRVFAERFGTSSPEEAMRLACETLRHECGENRAPIGLKAILQHVKARITFHKMDVAGRLELEHDSFNVLVNPRGSWRRHRFTIAHEIGHIIVLRAVATERRLVRALLKPSPELWRELERLCNNAAADLLMPRSEFQTLFAEYSFSPPGLRALYDRFLTSFGAMLVRIAATGVERAVVLWKRYARHEREVLTFRILACYSAPRGAWLPKGLTSSHFSPDVVTLAEQHHDKLETDVVVNFSRTTEQFLAAVVSLAAVERRSPDQLPIFHGHRVADEPHLSSSIAMLLTGKSARSLRARRNVAHLDFGTDPFVTAQGGYD